MGMCISVQYALDTDLFTKVTHRTPPDFWRNIQGVEENHEVEKCENRGVGGSEKEGRGEKHAKSTLKHLVCWKSRRTSLSVLLIWWEEISSSAVTSQLILLLDQGRDKEGLLSLLHTPLESCYDCSKASLCPPSLHRQLSKPLCKER